MYASLPEQIKLSSKTLGKRKRQSGEMFRAASAKYFQKVGLKAGTDRMAGGCNSRCGLGF